MDFREQTASSGMLDSVTKDTPVRFDAIDKYLQEWQNPHQADKLLYVEQKLLET